MLAITRLGQTEQPSATADVAGAAFAATSAYLACLKIVGPAAAAGCAATAWVSSPMHGELTLIPPSICLGPDLLKPGQYLRDQGWCGDFPDNAHTCEQLRLNTLEIYAEARARFRAEGKVLPADLDNINPIGMAACREPERVPTGKGIVPKQLHVYGPTIAEAKVLAAQAPFPGSSMFVAQLAPGALETFLARRAKQFTVFEPETNSYRILMRVE